MSDGGEVDWEQRLSESYWRSCYLLHSQTEFEEINMQMCILTMRVVHEHLEDWKRYTKESGLSRPAQSAWL
jgi:hypothetical protein